MRRKKMGVAMLVALVSMMFSAAVAAAITLITCTGTNPCEGTNRVDKIEDSGGYDEIYAYGDADDIESWSGGGDIIYAGAGNDDISGYTVSQIYGEGGSDFISTGRDAILIDGGDGNDSIFADDIDVESGGEDTVMGGPGNDSIWAADGQRDVINCGRGKRDWVEFDRGGVDTVTKCETKRAL